MTNKAPVTTPAPPSPGYETIFSVGNTLGVLFIVVLTPMAVRSFSRFLNSSFEEADRPFIIARFYMTIVAVVSAVHQAYTTVYGAFATASIKLPLFHRFFPLIAMLIFFQQHMRPVAGVFNVAYGLFSHVYCVAAVLFCTVYTATVPYTDTVGVNKTFMLQPFTVWTYKSSPSYWFDGGLPLAVGVMFVVGLLDRLSPSKVKRPLFYKLLFVYAVIHAMLGLLLIMEKSTATQELADAAKAIKGGKTTTKAPKGASTDPTFAQFFIGHTTPLVTVMALFVLVLTSFCTSDENRSMNVIIESSQAVNVPSGAINRPGPNVYTMPPPPPYPTK